MRAVASHVLRSRVHSSLGAEVLSIRYELAEEVRVRRGVWWKMKHTVPYSRVTSVDIIQVRFPGIWLATVDVYNGCYTGTRGSGWVPDKEGRVFHHVHPQCGGD